MPEKINIPEPCSVQWKDMQPLDGTKKHCLSCQTPVVDFTKKSLSEIHAFFDKPENRNVCGRYNERHTTHSSLFRRKLNSLENFFSRYGLRKPALLLISCILVLSSCHRHVRGRKTMGALFMNPKKDIKQSQQIKRV